MPQTSQPGDFTKLDDPAFLAERARTRRLLEHAPGNAVNRAELERLYEAMDAEFNRRARAEWTGESKTKKAVCTMHACSCGHTFASADDLESHLIDSFTPETDVGNDGQDHYETTTAETADDFSVPGSGEVRM